MKDMDNSIIQKNMDQAYDRWQNHSEWSKDDFWDQLDAEERVCVAVGNLNYQVENGGFYQWWDNRYYTEEVGNFLRRILSNIGTNACLQVIDLIERFVDLIPDLDDCDEDEYWDRKSAFSQSDDISSEYYEINERFLEDVEEALKNHSWLPQKEVA